MASVGEQPFKSKQSRRDLGVAASPHIGEVNLELLPSEERSLSSREVLRRWRSAVGSIPGAVEVVFSSSLMSSGEPINIQLQGNDLVQLTAAAERLKAHLQRYPGVADITDSFREGKRELELQILPSAEALGLTMADLGRQVRQAFYGEEVQRIQRGRDDVESWCAIPPSDRRSLADIENMRVRTPEGGEVPFRTVAATVIRTRLRDHPPQSTASASSTSPPMSTSRWPTPTRSSRRCRRASCRSCATSSRRNTLQPRGRAARAGRDSRCHGARLSPRPPRHLRAAGDSAAFVPAAADHHERHPLRADRRQSGATTSWAGISACSR